MTEDIYIYPADDEINIVTPNCVVCGKAGMLRVSARGYTDWMLGANIQEAFPSLDADQRELLVSGTHAHCWEAMKIEDDE